MAQSGANPSSASASLVTWFGGSSDRLNATRDVGVLIAHSTRDGHLSSALNEDGARRWTVVPDLNEVIHVLVGAIEMRRLFCMLVATLALAFIAPIPSNAGQSALAGHHSCEFTDYAWPIWPDASAQVGGHGTVEYDADTSGTITDGSMTIQAADDTHTFGQNRCHFELVSGN